MQKIKAKIYDFMKLMDTKLTEPVISLDHKEFNQFLAVKFLNSRNQKLEIAMNII